ncbi:MAG: hypothetical protein COB76_06325 [Alphaproteobacteria bacterium]|nr:MAG: hypothetical protein COB76_06325 [Alphaproteobacteria bacterium]
MYVFEDFTNASRIVRVDYDLSVPSVCLDMDLQHVERYAKKSDYEIEFRHRSERFENELAQMPKSKLWQRAKYSNDDGESISAKLDRGSYPVASTFYRIKGNFYNAVNQAICEVNSKTNSRVDTVVQVVTVKIENSGFRRYSVSPFEGAQKAPVSPQMLCCFH